MARPLVQVILEALVEADDRQLYFPGMEPVKKRPSWPDYRPNPPAPKNSDELARSIIAIMDKPLDTLIAKLGSEIETKRPDLSQMLKQAKQGIGNFFGRWFGKRESVEVNKATEDFLRKIINEKNEFPVEKGQPFPLTQSIKDRDKWWTLHNPPPNAAPPAPHVWHPNPYSFKDSLVVFKQELQRLIYGIVKQQADQYVRNLSNQQVDPLIKMWAMRSSKGNEMGLLKQIAQLKQQLDAKNLELKNKSKAHAGLTGGKDGGADVVPERPIPEPDDEPPAPLAPPDREMMDEPPEYKLEPGGEGDEGDGDISKLNFPEDEPEAPPEETEEDKKAREAKEREEEERKLKNPHDPGF